MSNLLLTTVFEKSRTRNAARLLMLALADRANEQGTCWPSIADLMQRTVLSRGALHHAMREAVQLGELQIVNRSNQNQTNIYRLTISSSPVQNLNQPRSDIEPAPVQILNKPRSESEPKPIGTLNKNQCTIARKKQSEQSEKEFNQFWEAYPRKASKPAAISAWKKTTKTRPPLPELLSALAKHKTRWNDPKFIPHPATWISGERWNDELTDSTPPHREIRLTSDIQEVRL